MENKKIYSTKLNSFKKSLKLLIIEYLTAKDYLSLIKTSTKFKLDEVNFSISFFKIISSLKKGGETGIINDISDIHKKFIHQCSEKEIFKSLAYFYEQKLQKDNNMKEYTINIYNRYGLEFISKFNQYLTNKDKFIYNFENYFYLDYYFFLDNETLFDNIKLIRTGSDYYIINFIEYSIKNNIKFSFVNHFEYKPKHLLKYFKFFCGSNKLMKLDFHSDDNYTDLVELITNKTYRALLNLDLQISINFRNLVSLINDNKYFNDVAKKIVHFKLSYFDNYYFDENLIYFEHNFPVISNLKELSFFDEFSDDNLLEFLNMLIQQNTSNITNLRIESKISLFVFFDKYIVNNFNNLNSFYYSYLPKSKEKIQMFSVSSIELFSYDLLEFKHFQRLKELFDKAALNTN